MHPAAKRLRDHIVEGDETSNSEYSASNGQFGTYFSNKLVKLDTQAKEDAGSKSSTIFNNCVCYITGFTRPSAPELKRLIVENGGSVCAYLGGKSYATHIVAESLTARKTELYANYKVVKPSWILECAKAGRMLNWTRFRTVPPPPNTAVFKELEDHEEENDGDDDDDEELIASGPNNNEIPPLGAGNVALDSDLSISPDDPETSEDAQVRYILRERQRVNCLDPRFFSDYYSKSRLHFLSTSKLMLRARCRRIKNHSLKNPRHRLILHVDFDSFFVSIALLKRPDLRNRPMCVSHGSDSSDIASCNYVAREAGVRNGMWVGRARTLCPDLVCLPYDFSEYTRCSDILYRTLIGLEPDYITAISIDEAMVDVSSLVSDNVATSADLATRIRDTVRAQTGGLEVSVGAGANILLAKLALRKAKPAGFHEILLEDAAQKVADVAVSDLPGVGYHIMAKLHDMGIEYVRDLEKWSLHVLQTRLGRSIGQMLVHAFQGLSSDKIADLDVPLRSVGVEIAWGIRTVSREEMVVFAHGMAVQLMERLSQIGSDCELLTVKLYRRSPDAPFIPPKYMGHGLCEIPSKSRRIMPQLHLSELQQMVVAIMDSFECPPLEFRGLGLHLRLKDTPASTIFTRGSPKPISSRRSKKMVALQPQRPKSPWITLTQQIATNRTPEAQRVDLNVLNELPLHIRREILQHEQDFNVVVPRITPEVGDVQIQQSERREHVSFLGIQNDVEFREVLKRWTASDAPMAEDVRRFCVYLDKVVANDPNWTKTIDLVDWLRWHIDKGESWQYLLRVLNSQIRRALEPRLGSLGPRARTRATYPD